MYLYNSIASPSAQFPHFSCFSIALSPHNSQALCSCFSLLRVPTSFCTLAQAFPFLVKSIPGTWAMHRFFCWLSAKEKISSGLCKAKEWGGGKNTTDFYFHCTHLLVKNSVPGTENQLKGRYVKERLLLTVSYAITPQSWSSPACCSTWDRDMSQWEPKGVWVMEMSLLCPTQNPSVEKPLSVTPTAKLGP